jgi:hypothetical protein
MNPNAGPQAMVAAGTPTRRAVDCPKGLEYLLSVDQLLIKQKIEVLELLTGFETNNHYDVQNNLGQNIFLASEDTDCCTRMCCGPQRPFDMRIIDHSQREVIHLERPLRCEACCFPCCLQELDVFAPPGHRIGRIIQEWSCLQPLFRVETASGQKVFQIVGPICTMSLFCDDVEFEVMYYQNNQKVGRITKQWSGLLREAFTDADFYGVVFPVDLDVKLKACLLAATFLIDYMYFEEKAGNNKNRRSSSRNR